MSSLSPKPIIAHTHRIIKVAGMTFAVVEDVERRVWIVESCPVGTRFWDLEQAAALTMGSRTRAAWHATVEAGKQLAQASKPATDMRVCPFKELNSEPASAAVQSSRQSTDDQARERKVRSRRTPSTSRTLSGV